MLSELKKIIPRPLIHLLRPSYHYLLALCAAARYRFPARSLTIIAVTGTKGKSSTTEILNHILEEVGYTTALSNTIRFKIGSTSKPNLYKMSMPGRFFMQSFLRDALNAGCTHAVIEMTSEGAKQFRHKWIDLDALIFTNLSPEHIESHGSFEKYKKAKLSIAKGLKYSSKSPTYILANKDDKEASAFLECGAQIKYTYSKIDAEPYTVTGKGLEFTFHGIRFTSPLQGIFNLYNILGALTMASALGINDTVLQKAIADFSEIKGRVQKIQVGQDFDVIVDYAHTIDSLKQLYQAFPTQRKICVLGNTGGGRDKWKRPGMAKIAEEYCAEIILTNEDPYDEAPEMIVTDMKKFITKKPVSIVMDRRIAIRDALTKARHGDVVLISGKGTDPYIMGPNDTKEVWDDATVVREELNRLE